MCLASIGLLSLPNWIVHISSSLEWGIAALMLFRYGKLAGRPEISFFGLAMLPHWTGSFFILGYHLSTDSIPLLLDLSETINLFGSVALLLATIRILKKSRAKTAANAAMGLGTVMIAGQPQSYLGNDIFDTILQISSVVYLVFLVLLVVVRKRDPEVFSRLTVTGFWFVLVFISVTIFFMYLATEVRGCPTLSHDDLLHGAAESLLTISNLMIVFGVHRQTRRLERRLRDASRPEEA